MDPKAIRFASRRANPTAIARVGLTWPYAGILRNTIFAKRKPFYRQILENTALRILQIGNFQKEVGQFFWHRDHTVMTGRELP
jgi:hypothetical protein